MELQYILTVLLLAIFAIVVAISEPKDSSYFIWKKRHDEDQAEIRRLKEENKMLIQDNETLEKMISEGCSDETDLSDYQAVDLDLLEQEEL